jgi:two-component sensor histidine kinase
MNIREMLLLNTGLKSEQIHTLEKMLEHLCFLKQFYDELRIIIPAREENRAVEILNDSDYNVVSLEDPELIKLLDKDFSHFPLPAASEIRSYTPVISDNPSPDLENLIEWCHQDLHQVYPVNYLVPDGIIVIDSLGKVLFTNYVARDICRRLNIKGESFMAIVEALGIKPMVFQEFLSRPAFVSSYIQIGHFDVSVLANPLFAGGAFTGAILVLSDLTLIKKKERELIKKSTVIKEIHHRVKNNLQTITSLLSLQMRRTNSEKVEKAFNESINRILSIAIIHEVLSQQELEIINLKQTVYKILEMILANMVSPNKAINGEICGEDVYLNARQASNLSLCITELIQNAVEHAFTNQTEGVIRITVEKIKDEVQITVKDNGSGIPSGGLQNVRSLGMQIVDTITQNNLNGRFFIEGSRAGTAAHIVFPAGSEEGGD